MRKSLLTMAVLAAIAAPHLVFAEEAKAEEAKAPYTIAYNVGLYSQYMFRGLTQTGNGPAVQGGADWTHESGFYLGTWASNIKWLKAAQAYNTSGVEVDLYGGYRNTIPSTEIGYDIGLYQYLYTGNPVGSDGVTANTMEATIGLSYQWLSAKAWVIATKDGLGVQDAQGSYYLELNANYPILDTGIVAIAHVGRQEFEGSGAFALSTGCSSNSCLSYTDWKIGATKSWDNGVTVGGYYTDTNVNSALYTDLSGEQLGNGTFTAYVMKTF
ncbi:MAG TPA: TorF family putative porin [Methylophilaceae bacterium]|jgi:uncharacterized protein (TIGR02001 family)